jgi:hypothetical protein
MWIDTVISVAASLGASWYVADRYFEHQRKIDKEIEAVEVQLAFKKLVHAYFPILRKRPKLRSEVRLAMDELDAKLKVYRPEWDVTKMQQDAVDEAMQIIAERPEDFEDA